MGYPLDVVEKGRKMVANGATLEEVRDALGKHVSLKTYESWLEHARLNQPKVADMLSMIKAQFDRQDAIAKQREALDAEASGIQAFLKAVNMTSRPQPAELPAE